MIKTFAPLASLFLGIAFLLCGNGLQTTLTPLRAEAEGFTALAIGFMGSAYFLGFVAGCLVGPYLIRQAGHIRAFTALVSAASAVALVHPLVIEPWTWSFARAVTGFALAGLYLIIESWLNDRATNENRGFVMSAYLIVSYGTITVGQMMVTLAPIGDFTLFAIASILVSIAVLPVAMTGSAQPAASRAVQFRPLHLFRVAPVGVVGAFMVGVTNSAFWTLGTLFALERGLGVDGAAIFMSVAVLGGAAAQWPVGRLSDRYDRRAVLAIVMAVAAAMSVLLALLPLGRIGIMGMALAFGMSTLCGYSVAAAHAYDRADKASYVEMAAFVLLVNGLGSIIGPALAAFLVDLTDAGALFLFIAGTQLLLIGFIVLRRWIRPASTADEKEDFDVFTTAPAGAVITRERHDRPKAAGAAST